MIIDLTRTIHDGMPVYPGDPQVTLSPIASIEFDGYENHVLKTSMHSGTHIDGPRHFIKNQPYISDFSLDAFIGIAKWMDQDLPYVYEGETILCIHTDGFLKEDLIQVIVSHPIKAIILEGDSPDEAPYLSHQQLLSKGIFIVENATHFDLLPKGSLFKAYIIPLKIQADSSPCRVFVEIEK